MITKGVKDPCNGFRCPGSSVWYLIPVGWPVHFPHFDTQYDHLFESYPGCFHLAYARMILHKVLKGVVDLVGLSPRRSRAGL